MTIKPPRTLDELAGVSGPAERAKAARAYVDQRNQAITKALEIRDEAIRELLAADYGPAAVARMCEVSVSTVKIARGRKAKR